MRIIGGARRGKKLEAPKGQETRPTTDRVRESLFNILSHGYADHVRDGYVLDAFCGTGALALESLSRGATEARLWDSSRQALKVASRNIEVCGFADRAELRQLSATTPETTPRPATLIFLDPPYGAGLLSRCVSALKSAGWIDQNSLLVIERASGSPESLPDGLDIVDDRRFGQTLITLAYLA
ncbi:MAG: 16S rRNA (guanine(966)-N(2))-methyltransferase RsmD [Alphaproteobacteria bacterium]